MEKLSTLIKSFVTIIATMVITHAALAQCNTPKSFKDWNWEETPADPANPSAIRPEYCSTWTARIGTVGSGVVTPKLIYSPWYRPGTPGLQAVNLAKDYQKSNGWELVRFNLGGGDITPIPYFILYHKPSGIVRIFAYIVTSDSFDKVLFTLNHSPTDASYPGRSPANISTAKPLLQAPNQYFAQVGNDPELLSYVSPYAGTSTWAMGQFTMLLDPNVGRDNDNYNLSSYQFQVYGIKTSNVTLNGALQFQTQNKEFGFSSFASGVSKDASGALTINTANQKFLGNVTSFQARLNDISKLAKDFAGILPVAATGPEKDLADKANAVAKFVDNKFLSDVSASTAKLAGFFGLAGSFIGLFADDAKSGTAFVPTYSKGTITLTGTITTTSPLTSFFVLTPGTKHYRANSGNTTTDPSQFTQLPFYNCPLGIFNIQNGPILRKIDYKREGGLHYYKGASDDDIIRKRNGAYLSDALDAVYCRSAVLTNELKPIVNAQSGLQIVSVKYAIGQTVPEAVLSKPWFDSQYNVYSNYYSYNMIRRYSFTYSQVSSGALEAYPVDPGDATAKTVAMVTIQTPFLEAGCSPQEGSNSIPFNTSLPTNDYPIFVRVVAELQQISNPTGPHTFFSQDYAPTYIDDSHASDWNLPSNVAWEADKIPPFHIFNVYPAPASYYAPDVVKDGNASYGVQQASGEIANNTLLFTNTSNISVISSSNTTPILFHAASSIGIEGNLIVPAGVEFAISTDFKSVYPQPAMYQPYDCSYPASSYAVYTPQCGYDSDAIRKSNPSTQVIAPDVIAEVLNTLTVSPNPASNSTLVQLKVPTDECIQQVELVGVTGQVKWRKQYDCTHAIATDIPLSTLPTALYVVRVTTSSKVYTCKLAVE